MPHAPLCAVYVHDIQHSLPPLECIPNYIITHSLGGLSWVPRDCFQVDVLVAEALCVALYRADSVPAATYVAAWFKPLQRDIRGLSTESLEM